ncbi:site-2 protease family protein [Candidatus Aerophobetes bacterium]|nr:site-2 protease family protein [Candidatus Aerophobetes bacterium]
MRLTKKLPALNVILFIATVGTTLIAGYFLSLPLARMGMFDKPWHGAIAFSLGVMGIIGSHELGHKLMADKRGIEASFPYFIPAPTFLGTFGAIIKMKTRPQDKNSLFDVGAAGPIGGFLVLLPVTALGIIWSTPITAEMLPEGTIALPDPLLFKAMGKLLLDIPEGTHLLLHPLAFAGWVGMLITMLNLMPVGVLDGGHITRALFGDRTLFRLSSVQVSSHRLVSLGGVLATALLGYWPMAILMLFFGTAGHPGPTNDNLPLSKGRKMIGVALFFLLVICAAPIRTLV